MLLIVGFCLPWILTCWWKLSYCMSREMKSMMLICYLFTLFWSAHGNNMVHYKFFSPHGKSKVITGQLWFGHLWCRHIGLSVRQRAKSFQMFWNVVNTQTHKQEEKKIWQSENLSLFLLCENFDLRFSLSCHALHIEDWCWLFFIFFKLRTFFTRKSKIMCPSALCEMRIEKQECV